MIFEGATLFFFEHFYWPVTVPFLYGFNVVIYYIIVGMTLAYPYRVKGYLGYGLFLGSLFFIRPLNPFQQVTVLDVDGEALIFEDRFSRCVGLIDGGGPWTAPNYLKHLKIKGYQTFDVVIVTHDHLDHTAGIEALINDPYFKIKNLITEKNAPTELTQTACGNIFMVQYPFFETTHLNNRSLVTGLFLDDFSVLVPGDIERIAESHYLQNPRVQYTYLQLPHHGSITSSSEAFLDGVKPVFAWANLPHKNVHQFPHEAVLERLEKRNIGWTTTEEKGTFIIRNPDFKP